MTKISLIAIIRVWHCVAYGQLSVNYNPYYIPYISTFVTQSHNQQNYDGTVDQLLERNSPFQGALFVKMKKLEAIAANLAKQLKDTTAKLEKNVSDLKDELKTTSNNLETATRNLASAMMELSSTRSDVADLTKQLNARTREIVDIGQMPTSCYDLQRMGHKLSGFFSVKGSKKMQMIYCDFNKVINEQAKWIGYDDIKSLPVYFHVQREYYSFSTLYVPIPFDFPLVNEGNAMNLGMGIFTAPVTGIYFFSFTGFAQFPSSSSLVQLGVSLNVNGNYFGSGWIEEANTVAYQLSPLTLQSTLNLKKGDQVWVAINWMSNGVKLFNDGRRLTQFTGFMLEEEIVASL